MAAVGSTAQIQDGRQALDMAKLTFFLWEITSKFFFLPWGFGLLAMRRNFFENRGRGILANSAIFRLFLRYLTNFTFILTVLTHTLKTWCI